MRSKLACRFFCSELVAQMLVQANRVNLKQNLDFLPSSKTDGHVLDAPIAAMCSTSSYPPELAEKLITSPARNSPEIPICTIVE